MLLLFQLQVKQAESATTTQTKPVTKATVDTSVTDIDAALNSLQVHTVHTASEGAGLLFAGIFGARGG